MMRRLVILALPALLACRGSDGELAELPEPFLHATAMQDCAPWDGPAVSILLTAEPLDSGLTPKAPYLRLAVWKDLGALQDAVFIWPSEEQVGSASYCAEENSCEAALTGLIQFRKLGADSSLAGEFELTFANEEPFSGGFLARWLPHTMLCG
jgi:hypothetical protein